jgi:cytoskeleton protein RodZ
MSLSLGEKLRQAREERGFTLSEVAEQTRISSLYLESIENDDYRILPGGIFNKGFVKSYAKFVGVNEQEALADYSQIIAQTTDSDESELKVYKPEVLTDDRSGGSMAPTIILAVVILGIMTAGVWFLVRYFRPPEEAPVANLGPKTNTNSAAENPAETTSPPSNAPEMATLKVEFKALSEPVSLTATSDGKMSSNVVTPGSIATFEPKESLKLSYSKSLANVVQLTINGKTITLPAQPLVPRRNAIEFEINKGNIAQIWTNGAISTDVPPAAPDPNANVAAAPSGAAPTNTAAATVSVATPAKTPVPRPTGEANTSSSPRPSATIKSVPTPKSTVIPIPPRNGL